MCILLVEDEWLIRSLVAEKLTECGFAVCEAEDGDHASALIAQDPAAYTLWVTDIHMPGSLDGLGIARVVRALRPDIPVVYTTGRPDALSHLQPRATRELLLPKPVALSDLVAAAHRLAWAQMLGTGGRRHSP